MSSSDQALTLAISRLVAQLQSGVQIPPEIQKSLQGYTSAGLQMAVINRAKFLQIDTTATSENELPALAGNPNRAYLIVQNNSNLIVRVSFSKVGRKNQGIKIDPGGNYEPDVVPTNPIFLYSVGNAPVALIEGQ